MAKIKDWKHWILLQVYKAFLLLSLTLTKISWCSLLGKFIKAMATSLPTECELLRYFAGAATFNKTTRSRTNTNQNESLRFTVLLSVILQGVVVLNVMALLCHPWEYPKNYLKGQTTLAYFSKPSWTKRDKIFITLTTGPNVIKLFASLIYECS